MREHIDRQPEYPGRVQLTPVQGQTNTYDLTRADGATVAGTPLNKALLDEFLAASGTTSGTASALTLAQDGFQLFDGATVRIKLSTNTDGVLSLDVNGTGSYPLDVRPGALAGSWHTVMFTGTQWVSVDADNAGTTLTTLVTPDPSRYTLCNGSVVPNPQTSALYGFLPFNTDLSGGNSLPALNGLTSHSLRSPTTGAMLFWGSALGQWAFCSTPWRGVISTYSQTFGSGYTFTGMYCDNNYWYLLVRNSVTVGYTHTYYFYRAPIANPASFTQVSTFSGGAAYQSGSLHISPFSADTNGIPLVYELATSSGVASIKYSLNSGVSWLTQALPSARPYFSTLNAVATDGNKIAIVSATSTSGSRYVSINTLGGAEAAWVNTGITEAYGNISVHLVDGLFVVRIGAGNYRVSEDGVTWTTHSMSSTYSMAQPLAFDDYIYFGIAGAHARIPRANLRNPGTPIKTVGLPVAGGNGDNIVLWMNSYTISSGMVAPTVSIGVPTYLKTR